MAVLPSWHERAVCSYADAFKEFVLEDPEVVAYAREGIKIAPEYEAVFIKGRCTPHGVAEWPVDSDRWTTIGFVHPDPEKRSVFCLAEPSPIEIALGAEALLGKYRALIGMLRRGELEAHGVAKSNGQVERIPQSIWQHEDFHISAQGDVFQINHQSENPPFDFLVRRWSAVELRRPVTARAGSTSTFHVQPTTFGEGPSSTSDYDASRLLHRALTERMPRKALAIGRALKAEGLLERPADLTDKEIAAKIALRVAGLNISPDALAKAVGRHYKKRPPSV